MASEVWSRAITQLEEISISKELPSTEASGLMGMFTPVLTQGIAESRSYLCALRANFVWPVNSQILEEDF